MSSEINKTENILIVDDDATALAFLSNVVKRANFNVRTVNRVEKAIQAVNEKLPDLIILDVTMPGISGFEYCAMLKKDPGTADIPVLFISGIDSRNERIKGFELGAVDFISKPFDIEEVTFRINTQIEFRRMRKELEDSNRKYHELMTGQIDEFLIEYKRMINAISILTEDVIGEDEREHFKVIGDNAHKLSLALQLLPEYENQITNEFITIISNVASLHDIGKLYVPSDIVNRAGELSPQEEEILKTHTVLGAEKLERVKNIYKNNSYLEMAQEIAMYHHENWDGSGYPKGISGTGIPLSARIIRIINNFGYRVIHQKKQFGKIDREAVFEDMRLDSGKKFDPDILNIFLKIKRQIKTPV